jgi:hypothetical protein
MILEYGQIEQLKGLEWAMIELRSEKTIESTMRRVGKAIPNIFRNDPIEIFIPVFNRDLDVFDMKTGAYIFVRSTNFQSLLRLKTITGVVSLVTEGGSNRPSKVIKVDDAYVQSIIKDAEEEFRKRAIGIEVGSWVRVLNGDTRDFCGTVEAIGDGKAIVRIILKTKSILLETPVRNLLNRSDVPPNRRVYYYCDLVDALVDEFHEEGLKLIAEDLTLEETTPSTDTQEEIVSNGVTKHSRQKTVTALVKKLVLIENQHDPLEIAKRVVTALKADEIKAPKNLFIVYCIIKDYLMKNYFLKIDPNLANYREVISKYGKSYKFSAQQIADIDPTLGIPVLTHEVCVDGRSREARQKTKNEKLVLRVGKKRGRPPYKVKAGLSPEVQISSAEEKKLRNGDKRVLSSKNKKRMLAGLRAWHIAKGHKMSQKKK